VLGACRVTTGPATGRRASDARHRNPPLGHALPLLRQDSAPRGFVVRAGLASQRGRIAAKLHTSGLLDERLPADTETALYRIAQEALTNVAKHARAANVDVILERRGDTVLLIIEDDGVGFDPAGAGGGGQGFGLLGMQERAGLVGAMLEIESAAGKGTTVLVRMATPVRSQTTSDHA
jgi:signal transduction histidine kinase